MEATSLETYFWYLKFHSCNSKQDIALWLLYTNALSAELLIINLIPWEKSVCYKIFCSRWQKGAKWTGERGSEWPRTTCSSKAMGDFTVLSTPALLHNTDISCSNPQ